MNEYRVVTDVEPTGFLEKLGNSFKGILFGLGLVVFATILLFWNEGRTIKQAGAIAEAELVTVDLPDISKIDPAFNGKVVYAKGPATTTDRLTDPLFGFTIEAIALDRKVQFYQWVEDSRTERVKREDGTEQDITTYSYQQKWTNSPIDSTRFHQAAQYPNNLITQAPLKNEKWLAPNVTFGAYTLPTFMSSAIDNSQPFALELSTEQIAKLKQQLMPQQPGNQPAGVIPLYQQPAPTVPLQGQQNMTQGSVAGQIAPQPAYQANQVSGYQANMIPTPQNNVHIQHNTIYLGVNQSTPQIGDIRIEFAKTPPTNISLVAQINGNTFTRFVASNGNQISFLSSQQESREVLFQGARNSNTLMSWLVRFGGIVLVIIGFKLVFGPLVLVANLIPLVGGIIEAGAGLIATLLGLSWSFLIIAIAWVRYRPILGISLLVIAALLIAFMFWKGRRKEAA